MTYKLPPGVGAYHTRRARRLSGLGDDYTNPDGTPTYDGLPYDPDDPNNPYNSGNETPEPATIAIQTTSMGPAPTQVSIAPTTTTPVTGFTPLPSTTPTTTPVAAPSSNGIANFLNTLFKPATPAPVAYGTPLPASILPTSSSSTTTLLLLAAAGIGLVVFMGKKKGAR